MPRETHVMTRTDRTAVRMESRVTLPKFCLRR